MNIPRDHKPGGAAVTGSRFRPPPGTDRYLSRFVRWDGLSVLSCCADGGSVLPSLNGERPSGGTVWSYFSLSMSQCTASCCHFWFTKRSIRGYFDVFLPSWWFGSTPGRMEMRNHDLIQSPAPCAGLDMLGFLFLSYKISYLKTTQRLSKMCFLALRTLMNLSKRPKQTQTMQIWDGTSMDKHWDHLQILATRFGREGKKSLALMALNPLLAQLTMGLQPRDFRENT